MDTTMLSFYLIFYFLFTAYIITREEERRRVINEDGDIEWEGVEYKADEE
jgi:hypothetical protein